MKKPYHFELQNVSVEYKLSKKKLVALNDISLSGHRSETIAVVGESGSGKSTLGKALLQLEKVTTGAVLFNGIDLATLSSAQLRHMRKKMQMIFQDPTSSLNPRMTVRNHLIEALTTHNLFENEKQVDMLLEMVHLSPEIAKRYPFELSGGQKQRISIARALSVQPELLVLDEPLSSLDVSVRAQIIKLLQELQKNFQLTYLFITHDLATLPYLAHKVAVLYLGHIVEFSAVESLYQNPLHPYTKALLSAISIPDPEKEKARTRTFLLGEPPSPLSPPSGCPFQTRCPHATNICREKKPELKEAEPGRFVACHYEKFGVR